MKLKYPRYPKEQNLACKLTEKDIQKIRTLREQGFKSQEIAPRFKVSYQAIDYWFLPADKRKQYCKRHYLLWEKDSEDIEDKHERQVRSVLRKLKLMPEFVKYHRQFEG